jgi:hypothetical protein
VCHAYQQLIKFGEIVDIGAWFEAFCSAHGIVGAADRHPSHGQGGASIRRRKRKRMKTVERSGGVAQVAEVRSSVYSFVSGDGAPGVRVVDNWHVLLQRLLVGYVPPHMP